MLSWSSFSTLLLIAVVGTACTETELARSDAGASGTPFGAVVGDALGWDAVNSRPDAHTSIGQPGCPWCDTGSAVTDNGGQPQQADVATGDTKQPDAGVSTSDTGDGPDPDVAVSDGELWDALANPTADGGSTGAGAPPLPDAGLPDVPGQPPEDTGFVTPPDPCTDPGTGQPLSCDDGLWCTSDWCDGGKCLHSHDTGCLIGGACFGDGEQNPANGCQRCHPDVSTASWMDDLGVPTVPSSPPGSAAKRFDVASLNCSACGASCATDDEKCLCTDDFQALNAPGKPHFLALGSEKWRPAAWAQGNYAAVYIDSFIDGWGQGKSGTQAAQDMLANEAGDWPSGLAAWFIVNEISASLWPSNAAYRQYVVDYAKGIAAAGKKPVILAPFGAPGNAWPEWKALAQAAYVGAESYEATTGQKVNASGNSVAYCKAAYQKTIDAYASVGVPLSKLFLVEHFGQTMKDTNWGRSGVSTAGWHNAIEARSKAASQLGFAGFVSYGWGSNLMHVAPSERLSFIDTYSAQTLP